MQHVSVGLISHSSNLKKYIYILNSFTNSFFLNECSMTIIMYNENMLLFLNSIVKSAMVSYYEAMVLSPEITPKYPAVTP